MNTYADSIAAFIAFIRDASAFVVILILVGFLWDPMSWLMSGRGNRHRDARESR